LELIIEIYLELI